MSDFRGKGYSKDLIEEFESRVKMKETYCQLTVEENNKRAISFYEKKGYKAYKSSGNKVYYYKNLNI